MNKSTAEILFNSYTFFNSEEIRIALKADKITDYSLSEIIEKYAPSNIVSIDLIDSANIYIPNLLSANTNLNPIYCLGTDLNPLLDLNEHDDYIPGFYYNEDSIYIEILLNEQMTLAEERMVIIYNGLPAEFGEKKSYTEYFNTPSTYKINNINTTVPYINSFKINYRYEENGDSEYNMRIVTLWSSGGYTLSTKYHIQDVKENEIGTILYDDYQIDFEATVLSQYIVFYEHDWYATYVPIVMSGTGGPIENSVVIPVRMAYNYEYYQKIWLDYSGSAWQTFYTKGFVDIHAHL